MREMQNVIMSPTRPWKTSPSAKHRRGAEHLTGEMPLIRLDLGPATAPPTPAAFAMPYALTSPAQQLVLRALERMNLAYACTDATYIWIEIPPYSSSSTTFAAALRQATGVAILPGSAWNAQGEGYARITLIQDLQQLAEAMERWERWLIGCSLHLEDTWAT